VNEHDAIERIKRLSHSINCADEIAEVIERLIKERDEAMQKCDEHLIKTLQAYDRLSILMENIMEQWLDGDNAPPKELIDAYYDVKDDVNEHLNVDRLHEQVIPANSEFYEKIQKKFSVDDTPNLW
jgi:translation initiation factor 2B subunit (eIF-2B alpha/beta/delta family)